MVASGSAGYAGARWRRDGSDQVVRLAEATVFQTAASRVKTEGLELFNG